MVKRGSAIILNAEFVASQTLEAFQKSNIRQQYLPHYAADAIDKLMEEDYNKCLKLYPQAKSTDTGQGKPASEVDFVVNTKYLKAHGDSTAKEGDTIQVPAADVKKYK